MTFRREDVAVIGSIFIFGSQWSKEHHKMFSAQDISNLCIVSLDFSENSESVLAAGFRILQLHYSNL